MSWKCQQCEQTTTFSDVVDTLFKVAAIAGIGYLVINFRSEIKDTVQVALSKAKKSSVSGIAKGKRTKK